MSEVSICSFIECAKISVILSADWLVNFFEIFNTCIYQSASNHLVFWRKWHGVAGRWKSDKHKIIEGPPTLRVKNYSQENRNLTVDGQTHRIDFNIRPTLEQICRLKCKMFFSSGVRFEIFHVENSLQLISKSPFNIVPLTFQLVKSPLSSGEGEPDIC